MHRSTASVLNTDWTTLDIVHPKKSRDESLNIKSQRLELLSLLSMDAYSYVSQAIPIKSERVHVIDSSRSVILKKNGKSVIGIVDVNFETITNETNDYLFSINSQLKESGIFIGCSRVSDLETSRQYKSIRILKKTASYILPGKNKLLSKAEVLGRIVYSGFTIVEFKEIDGLLFYMVMKIKDAPKIKEGCSDNFIFSMSRIGYDGKKLTVFKFRTMHPYSKYLQDYVVRMNGYNHVGKPANDFRLTPWGKFFRKYWLDELPQIFNMLKGELSLVGVRPLSDTRFKELPLEVQHQRIKFKPGCIPPYVALNMPDSKGNIEAESIYMNERLSKGYVTDIKYFFLAIYNIFSGKIKSS